MIENPSVGDDAGVELAHEALPDIIHAVLIVSLVELRHTLLLVPRLGEVPHVMILPDVMQAVQLVRADGGSDVATAGFGRELCRPVGMFHHFDVLLGYADEAICIIIIIVHLAKGYFCGSEIEGFLGEQISIHLHFIMSYQALSTSGVGGPLKGL